MRSRRSKCGWVPLMGTVLLASWPGMAGGRPVPQNEPAPGAVKTVQDALDQRKRESVNPAAPSPVSEMNTLFGPDLYPVEALRADEQGRVVVTLSIDEQGRVTDCKLVQSSGSTSLDETTCRQARLALFKPGRDARGRPIASTFTMPVRWQLPEADGASALEIAQGNINIAVELKVSAAGVVTACRSLVAEQPLLCDSYPIGQPFRQRYLRNGASVAATIVIRMSETVAAVP